MVRAGHLNFHVVEWGDPRNAPVLLLHGRSANAMDLHRLAASLADRYRVVAFDQRGHGLTDRPGRYSQRLLAGDVAGVVAAVGLGVFALIGHSMGGGIAWSFAARQPDNLRCLVLLEASPEPPGVHEPDSPMPQTPPGLAGPEQIIAWAAAQGWTRRIGRQDLGRWLTRYARPMPGGYLAAYDEAAYDQAYVSGHMWPGNRTEWRAISRITCPTLVVIGEHGAVGQELGTLLTRRLRQGAFAVIPRAGHSVHLENLPATLAAVRPFLDAHQPAA
jgi:pimeloyl-ACP methyl ester carboxylesterase